MAALSINRLLRSVSRLPSQTLLIRNYYQLQGHGCLTSTCLSPGSSHTFIKSQLLDLKMNRASYNYSTAATVCKNWKKRFQHAGIPEPKESAELIVAHAMGKKMIHEVTLTDKIPAETLEQIETMCLKRLNRCPVQYILGEWEFYNLTLIMRPPVLIPRPETEDFAGYILEDIKKNWKSSVINPVILDVGCGTGAIGLFLAHSLPWSICVAMDKSEAACDLTRENASRLKVFDRMSVMAADIKKDTTIDLLSQCGPYDVIVSNPPYIPTERMVDLDYQISHYEDPLALDGGEDGLDIVRVLLTRSAELLKDDGYLWLELEYDQAKVVQDLVKKSPRRGLTFCETLNDYVDVPRFVKLQKVARRKLSNSEESNEVTAA